MTPLFPRSGPGESSSPTSQVILRCYDFPARIPGHLFVSLPGSTLPSSVRVSQLALALPEGRRVPSGPGSMFNRRPNCRLALTWTCLCLGPRPRPNRRSLAYCRFRRCCPRSDDSEGFSVMVISGLSRGFSTCCLRFKNGVATIHARLASGRLARLYREGVEPSGSQ